MIVRQRFIPSACDASRSVFGTSRITSCADREMSGSMMMASARDAAMPDWPAAGDQQSEDEHADDDARQALHEVEQRS